MNVKTVNIQSKMRHLNIIIQHIDLIENVGNVIVYTEEKYCS